MASQPMGLSGASGGDSESYTTTAAEEASARPTSSSALLPRDTAAHTADVDAAGLGGQLLAHEDEHMAPTRRISGSKVHLAHGRSKSMNGHIHHAADGSDSEPRGSDRGMEMDDIESEDEMPASVPVVEETIVPVPSRKRAVSVTVPILVEEPPKKRAKGQDGVVHVPKVEVDVGEEEREEEVAKRVGRSATGRSRKHHRPQRGADQHQGSTGLRRLLPLIDAIRGMESCESTRGTSRRRSQEVAGVWCMKLRANWKRKRC